MTGTPSARLVHSVIATCLTEPGREECVAASLPEPLDIEAVSYFAGLAEKVRHNGIRRDLELTFRLLRLSGLEMELFRDYAPASAQRRARGLTSPTERLTGLMDFASEWAGTDEDRCLIRDVLRHEQIIAGFRRAPKLQAADSGGPVTHESVVSLHGTVIVVDAVCDPMQVADVLRARVPDLTAIVRRSVLMVYHRAPSGQVRMIEVSEGVPCLLEAVDGISDVHELGARLLGDGESTDAVVGYAALCDLGLVRVSSRD